MRTGKSLFTLALLLTAAAALAQVPPQGDPLRLATPKISVAAPVENTDDPAATQPATAPAADPRWEKLIQKLGDPDPATRQAAQDELDKTTWRDLETLQKLAESADGAEAKARLAARAAQIQEDLAINPPPISLHYKNASTTDLAADLTKILGTQVEVWPPNQVAQGVPISFTLDATDVPFWDAFLKLSRQHPMQFDAVNFTDRRLRLDVSGSGWSDGVVAGPLLIIPQNIVRSQTVDLQQHTPVREELRFSYMWAIDPRIHFQQMSQPVLTSALDDQGNKLVEALPPEPDRVLLDLNGRSAISGSASATLHIPANIGKRIASAKGSMTFLAELGEAKVEVMDPGSKIGQTFTVGDAQIKLTGFTTNAAAQNLNVNLELVGASAVPRIVGGRRVVASGPAVEVAVVDATGREVTHNVVRTNMGMGVGGGIVFPVKLRFTSPTKTKEITLPFELKDLPLP